MAKQDYYDLLGVEKGADEKALKSAFRKKAMQYHPDRNKDEGAETKFKEINEAYEILKDPQKRAAYDQYGHAAFEQGGMGGGGFGGGGGFSGFSDIFEDMFGNFGGGGGRQRGQNHRGADLQYNMQINLEDAFEGKTSQVRIPTSAACGSCDGSGAEAGSQPVTCSSCGGRGKVRAQQGFFTVERACPTCQGAGETISNPCKSCSGQGRVQKDKTLNVNIPAGVEDGTRIRLGGEGEAGLRGAPSGDLYIFLNMSAHDIFDREGADLFVDVPIAMTKAALGGQIEVPSIDGTRSRISIPAGTQSGKQFRLRGKGMSIYQRSNRGDLYVKVLVETPTKLNKRQRELLEEFDKEASTSPESDSFFDKMKSVFKD
ncbi:MAG: molecular chaperone DnaJ [Alphaproteobacteria bacterium]